MAFQCIYFNINLPELLQEVGQEFNNQVLTLTCKDRYDAVVSPVEFLEERFGRTKAPPKFTFKQVPSSDNKAEKLWRCRLQIGTSYKNKYKEVQERGKFEAALHFAVEFMENVDHLTRPKPRSLYFDRETIAILCRGINAETFLTAKFKNTDTRTEYKPFGHRCQVQFERLGFQYKQKLRIGSKVTQGKGFTVNDANRQATLKMLYILRLIEHYPTHVDDVMGIPQAVETEIVRLMKELREQCKERHVPYMVTFRAIEGMDTECRIFAMGNTAVGIGAGSRLAEFVASKSILSQCGYADDIKKLEEKWRPFPASQNESSKMVAKPEVKSDPSEKSEVAAKSAQCSKAEVGLYQWSCKIVMENDCVRVYDESEEVKRMAANWMLMDIDSAKPFKFDVSYYCDSHKEDDERPRAALMLIGDINRVNPKKKAKETLKKMLIMAEYLDESPL